MGTFRVLCHAYGAADRSTGPAPIYYTDGEELIGVELAAPRATQTPNTLTGTDPSSSSGVEVSDGPGRSEEGSLSPWHAIESGQHAGVYHLKDPDTVTAKEREQLPCRYSGYS